MKREKGRGKREKCIHRGAIIFNFQLILRLPQVLEDELHLPPGEVAVIDTVARSKQRGQQAVGVVDVAVESAQGVRGGTDGEVHRGELALGERVKRPLPRLSQGEGLTDIVVVHNCVVFRVVRC